MRIITLSDRIFQGSSAYTKITRETCLRLTAKGHKMAHIPMGYANRMGEQTWNNITIYRSGLNAFGEDVAAHHYNDFNADLLITIKEPWVFHRIHNESLNFVPMAIIDHEPVNTQILTRLNTAFKTIAITRFGQRQLKKHNITSNYIPHAINTEILKPHPDKNQCKKLWYLEPDSFIIGIVAMNRTRKMIPRMLRGYKRFLENNPDINTHLFLWTGMQPNKPIPEMVEAGVSDIGINLIEEIIRLEISKGKNDVRWIDPTDWNKIQSKGGIPEYDPNPTSWDMNKLYNAFDCLLLASGGEGFGMPLIEAQSCGTPVITTDYAGAPEQVGAGITVPYNDYIIYDSPGTRRALANIDKMSDALTKIYNSDRTKLGKRARRFALRYDWNNVMDNYWTPFLEECNNELYPKITKEGISTWR